MDSGVRRREQHNGRMGRPMSGRDLRSAGADVRLIAVDLDGTLLGADGEVPPGLWPILRTMRERGIVFAPASGRQYATLLRLFDRDAAGMPFIAENGTFVVRDDREISSAPLTASTVTAVLDARDALRDRGGDVGVVVCGKRCAFVDRSDEAFLAEVRKYYVALDLVANLRSVDHEPIKLAVFDFGDAATSTAPALSSVAETDQVVVSGPHWVDVMARGANKGVALSALQEELGVTREQTAAFGDYLNDLEMLEAAGLSFAMENAHPDIKLAARFQAPHHEAGGVITVLSEILSL
jgi:Cof subfamily protein (haloacid dehalogenase superfamily)